MPTISDPVLLLVQPPGPSTKSVQALPDGSLSNFPDHAGSPAPQPFRDAVSVRALVFVVEQKCQPEIEIDEDDQISWHWNIYSSQAPGTAEIPAATIRLIPAQAQPDADDVRAVDGPNYAASIIWDRKEPYVTIGRLATLKEFRGRGYARILVEAAVDYAKDHPDLMVKDNKLGQWKGLVMVHAQVQLENWYASLGFERDVGMGTWWEDGIEHVGSWRRMDVGAHANP